MYRHEFCAEKGVQPVRKCTCFVSAGYLVKYLASHSCRRGTLSNAKRRTGVVDVSWSSRRPVSKLERRQRTRVGASTATRRKGFRDGHCSTNTTTADPSMANLSRSEELAASKAFVANRFVFDINVHLPDGATGELTKRISKRVLLDTGADLNLISYPAFRDVLAPMVRFPESINSLGGQTSIDGDTCLSFTFLNRDSTSTNQRSVHSERFFVISPHEPVFFDLILGHRWIFDHMEDFIALMSSRK